MSPIDLGPRPLGSQAAAAAETQDPARAKRNEQALKSAKEFESIMLKHLLESLQKTAEVGGKHGSSGAYQSMAVEALANGIEQGGGLGLADLIAHSLQAEISKPKP